jgi:hypothetical protein
MSNSKLLDRSAYSATTMSTYQLLSSYIVDVYYNHLYIEAIKMKNDASNPVTSITEGYKHAVLAFLSAIDNKSKTYKARHYAQLLKGINEYFTTWTSFSTLTLSDCINKIVTEFVPSDFFESLNKDQRRNILRVVLTSGIRGFSEVVIKDFLTIIIDNHKEQSNIHALKERMVDLFIIERDGFYNKFLLTKIGKTSETVDKSLALKMQREIKGLLKDKKELTDENDRLTAENDRLTVENTTRVEQVKQVIQKYKILATKHKGLARQYDQLQDQMDEPDDEPDARHFNPRPVYNTPVSQRDHKSEHPTRSSIVTSSTSQSPYTGGDVEISSNGNAAVEIESTSVPPVISDITIEDDSDSYPDSPPPVMSAKERRANAVANRKEEKAAAKAAAKAELERAESERKENAHKEAANRLASSLASSGDRRRTVDMGDAPSIGSIDDIY